MTQIQRFWKEGHLPPLCGQGSPFGQFGSPRSILVTGLGAGQLVLFMLMLQALLR